MIPDSAPSGVACLREAPMKFTYANGDRPLEGYTLKHGIGRGGFGEVYHAVSDGGKEVALKLVQRHLNVELRGVGQCLNLKHPHLVALYDVKQGDNGDTWVVMEYMAGEALDQVVARHAEGMPAEDVLHWLRGLCEGVGHLHERGIVHRDLKPGNIFVEHGTVKVGDYGLSKFISHSRRSGQTESIGTVHYMAPEIANGRYGKEIDLYAIGIMFYEMLTGRVPFDGESPGEILMKHLTASPDLSLLPEEYRGVIGRLLEKDPQRRYSSIPALLADLPSLAGSSRPILYAGWTAGTRSSSEAVEVVEAIAAPVEPEARADRRHGVTPAQPAEPGQPADGIWTEFVRRDPILGLLRSLSPLARVLAIVVAVLVWPVLGAFLAYCGVALLIRFLERNRAALAGLWRISGRLLVSAFFGAGAGLVTAGGATFLLRDSVPDETELLCLCLGTGFLTATVFFSVLCWWAAPVTRSWRVVAALLFAPSVGLLTAAGIMALWARHADRNWGSVNPRQLPSVEWTQYYRARATWEARALFFGLGTGLLAFGGTVGLALLRRSQRRQAAETPRPAGPAVPDTRIGQTQSWHPFGPGSQHRLIHSLQSHRLLWFVCLFLTGTVLVTVTYPLYVKLHENHYSVTGHIPKPIEFLFWFVGGILISFLISATLTAWVSLLRTLRPRHPEIQLPEPVPPERG